MVFMKAAMPGTKNFRGGVMASEIEGGRVGARIFVQADLLHAHTDSGQDFDLPFASMQLEVGGASGRMLFCRNPERTLTIYCEEPGFIFALTRIAGEHVGEQLAPSKPGFLGFTWTRVVAVAAVAVVCVAALWSLPTLARWVIYSAVDTLPSSVDEKLGRSVLASMHLGKACENVLVKQSVDDVLQRLAQQTPSGSKFSLHIVEGDAFNAFSLPGGQIVVYTGLLQHARRPEYLAGVLAHEMGHVLHRHGIQRLAQSLGVIATVQYCLGDVGGLFSWGKEFLTLAAVNNYSRADEAQADATAVQLLHDADIDPLSLAAFFETLQHNEKEPMNYALPSWLSDHPALDERIDAVRSLNRSLGPSASRPLVPDWGDVQAHLSLCDDSGSP